MRIALDTSGYSAFMRGHEGLINRLQLADEIVLNIIVLGELLAGFRRGTRFSENLQRLDQFRASPRVRIAVLDEETADRYAEILSYLRHAGRPIPTNDIWIAASAMHLGLRVVTTDPHFDAVPQVASEVFTV